MTRAAPKCPICGRPPAPATKPFCSPRCADVDLGRWFGERYAVPASPPGSDPPDEDAA